MIHYKNYTKIQDLINEINVVRLLSYLGYKVDNNPIKCEWETQTMWLSRRILYIP